ncbi:MAG: hypothetical protein KUG61_04510 [Parvibaculaceae bacterium]|nr:hypothetical protein [Parvibaculaceae bacterium]
MKSWNFIYHICAGLCLLLISTTSYTHEIRAAGINQLETGAIWFPHRENYHLPTTNGSTLFKVNANTHSLPSEVLGQCGYKSAANNPEVQQPLISMRIITDKAEGHSLPWPGSAVSGDTRRHAIVYQTTSEPSFSFPRTSTDTTSPPTCLYFFRLTPVATEQTASAEPIIQRTPASQLVLKLTRKKGNIRYDPLYFELSSPLAASSPRDAQAVETNSAAQKIYNIALMLNSSAMYRTASTTTHQFGYFQLPWALVLKNIELTPNHPCQIIWSKSSLHASHCAVGDTLQVLMPTYPTQPLPQFDQSLMLSEDSADNEEHHPTKPFGLPAIPPKPIVFAMLTTLESGFTPYWQQNLEGLTMLSGSDHTSKIFTQTLSFIDQGS